jgi:hypothetical protein
MDTHEIVQIQVCRSQDEVLTTGERWRAAMIEKRWGGSSPLTNDD